MINIIDKYIKNNNINVYDILNCSNDLKKEKEIQVLLANKQEILKLKLFQKTFLRKLQKFKFERSNDDLRAIKRRNFWFKSKNIKTEILFVF